MGWLKYWFTFTMGVVIGIMFVFCRLYYYNTYAIGKANTMVSYEYTTQCRCGGTIEGYQSLVDDYNREEYKKCGYHNE